MSYEVRQDAQMYTTSVYVPAILSSMARGKTHRIAFTAFCPILTHGTHSLAIVCLPSSMLTINSCMKRSSSNASADTQRNRGGL